MLSTIGCEEASGAIIPCFDSLYQSRLAAYDLVIAFDNLASDFGYIDLGVQPTDEISAATQMYAVAA